VATPSRHSTPYTACSLRRGGPGRGRAAVSVAAASDAAGQATAHLSARPSAVMLGADARLGRDSTV